MKRSLSPLLLALLCLLVLCSAAQALMDLQITVRDGIDNTSIPSANVYLNGVQYAMTNNNGQVAIPRTGLTDNRIRISTIGYNDWENFVAINQTSLLVNLSRKKVALKVKLYDSDSLGPIAGGLVNVSAMGYTQSKLSDASGAAEFSVNASMLYSVDISAPNYEPRSGTAEIGMENKDVQFWLLSGNKYSFVVNDKESRVPVPGAEVRINSVLVGKTDERGILSTPVARGKEYTIEIKKEGYDTFTELRTISDADALFTAEITKAPLGAFVYVYDENNRPVNGAEIYINGSLSGTTNEYGRSTFPDLIFGSYPVEVRKTGFIPSGRTIAVSNKSGEYAFTLHFENAVLTITVQDKDQKSIPNASIAIDGTASGQADDHGQLVTKVKFNQIYNITASHDGYQSASVQKQVVPGNATSSVTVTLEKTMDLGFIGTIAIIIIVVMILFAVFRMFRQRPGHHVMRRNEI
jgi:hypothetical protein